MGILYRTEESKENISAEGAGNECHVDVMSIRACNLIKTTTTKTIVSRNDTLRYPWPSKPPNNLIQSSSKLTAQEWYVFSVGG